MLKIYTVEEARKGLLQREPIQAQKFPPAVLERTARLFGPGTTPAQAVAQFLAEVRLEGDATLQREQAAGWGGPD